MRNTQNWTVSYRLANAFQAWLEENELQFDSYEYGAQWVVFEVNVNEYEEDAIDEFLDDGIYEYAGIDTNDEYGECEPY